MANSPFDVTVDYKKLEELENLEARIGFRLDKFGHEVPDPTPLSLPSGFRRPETLQEQVRRLVRTQLSQAAAEQGEETFEESEDFDVDDDFDPSTPFEVFFDPALNREVSADEFARNHEKYKQRYMKAQAEYYQKMDADDIIHDNLIRRAYMEKQRGAGQPAPREAEGRSSLAPEAPPAKQS